MKIFFASSLVQCHSPSLLLADGALRTGPWILNPPSRGSGGGLAIVFSNFLQRANLVFNVLMRVSRLLTILARVFPQRDDRKLAPRARLPICLHKAASVL